MADAYLTIAEIAANPAMNSRVTACAAQQERAGLTIEPDAPTWTLHNRYLWASSPTWGEKWDYAVQTHPPEPTPPPDPENPVATAAPYDPGADPAVITDGDILSTVQTLSGE